MERTYLNVPSAGAITQAQAYKIACKRWSVHVRENRYTAAGIVYKGDHGEEMYVDWIDLPAPTREHN